MAEKPRSPAPQPKGRQGKQENQPAKKKSRAIFKLLVALLVVLTLAGVAVGAGIYFRLIDPLSLAHQYKLHEYPVIGQYIPRPATLNFEPVELPPEQAAGKDKPAPANTAVQAAPEPRPAAAMPEEIRENLAKAKREEAKRISRLARLYSEMKPDEAVPILNRLDDNTVLAILAKMEDGQAAKILTLFDAQRAARLTEDMLKGKTM